MPRKIEGPISTVTLPSRLRLLGRQSFRLAAALRPIRLGNAVVGFAPSLYSADVKGVCARFCGLSCCSCWSASFQYLFSSLCGGKKVKNQIFLLPGIFSKSMARIGVFVRCLLLLLFVLLVLVLAKVDDINVGRAWIIGTSISLFTMYKLSQFRKAPDGVRVFLRSLGAPDIEEYMFSYSWKVQPENIRTLARALWSAGVGVWIDVVKLCPGDEIRPMVRTTVDRVQRVVVFLSQEYCDSPNCCVEFMEAVQHPKKLVICILNEVHPNIRMFVENLRMSGAVVVEGLEPLMARLDYELQDMTDADAVEWWRKQRLSGAGVPMNMVPFSWPIPMCSIWGKIFVPSRSLEVGPCYIAGNLRSTGQAFRPPYLLLLALTSIGASLVDLYLKYSEYQNLHTVYDYIWLAAVCTCNIAPFFAFKHLLETRRDLHMALRPLLASRSFGGGGVKVRVIGNPTDPVYVGLVEFLKRIGHLWCEGDDTAPIMGRFTLKHVSVYVMDSIEMRDKLFGGPRLNFDKNSLFIWSNDKTDPFSKNYVGERLMRYLVLVAGWEKNHLAASLFSAIGVRVVDILHDKESRSAVRHSFEQLPSTV